MVAALLRWAADGLEEEPGGKMEICNYYPLEVRRGRYWGFGVFLGAVP